ncbi:MAG: hypothetical protein FJX68_13225 [Alphaproteobacteria bacterium]|nr:hypothetical protein [Alphaproteobacteria bacterium]
MPDVDLWAHLNGRLVRGREAVIPIEDRGVQWGDAVYDSIRTYGGKPFQMDFRIDRFFRSMQYARIAPPLGKVALRQATLDVVRENMKLVAADDDITVNYYVSRGSMKTERGLTPAGTFAIFCRQVAFASFAKFYVEGAPGITPATRRTPPECVSPKAKVSNKMNHFVAELEAKAHNPDAFAVMLDLEGNITEGSGANFLFVSEGRIKVPDTRLVLSGADMASVAELAGAMQIGCDEGTFTAYDVYTADEAFFTTNSFGILPVTSLNGLPIGDGKVGPLTRRLMAAWQEQVGIDYVGQAIARLPATDRQRLETQRRAMAD